MSTSLKRLLDAEAARTEIPPPPVAAVVAGRQARVRRRRIIGVAVAAAVAAVLAIAIPLGVTKGGSDNDPIGPPDIGWRHLDGPWTDQRSIHFGDATAPRPPGWKVDTLTSTRDSALYTAPRKDGRGDRLYELRRDASVRQLSSHQVFTLRADPTGRYVAWQELQAKKIVLVVYDTASAEVVARLPAGRAGVMVTAVDGDTVIYGDSSSPQIYVWHPDRGDPEPLGVTVPKRSFVADAGNGLLMISSTGGSRDSYVVDETGERVLTFSGPALGEFDPSGRYLALTKMSRGQDVVGYAVRALDAAKDTELSGYDGDIVQASWDPSGSLVLATVEQLNDGLVPPDDELTFYRCEPATGGCALIEGSTTTVDAAPESANLQVILPLSSMQDWTS